MSAEKANRPPGRSRRAASGTLRCGSVNVIAPKSQKTTSKLPVPQPGRLGAGVHERELEPGGRHQLARVLELACRVVEAGHARALACERDRPLGGAAAELEHVEAAHLAEHLQLGLGDLPHAPGGAAGLLELAAVARLVLVGLLVPQAAIQGRVVGEGLLGHRASLFQALPALARVGAAGPDARGPPLDSPACER